MVSIVKRLQVLLPVMRSVRRSGPFGCQAIDRRSAPSVVNARSGPPPTAATQTSALGNPVAVLDSR